MRHLVVVALLSFAAINASPINVKSNNIEDIVTAKLDLSAVLSNKIDQNVINAIIVALSQQGVVVGNIDASENQNDEVSLMKKMLKRKIKLPQVVEAPSATQHGSARVPKVDFKKKLESKIAQLKDKLPENFKFPQNFDFENNKLPVKYEALAAAKPIQARSSFKIPESVQLPEKFARKFEIAEVNKAEKTQKPVKTVEDLPEKLQYKLNQMMMKKSENSESFKDFKIPENLSEKLKQKLAYKLHM
jgi:hypothetical protein